MSNVFCWLYLPYWPVRDQVAAACADCLPVLNAGVCSHCPWPGQTVLLVLAAPGGGPLVEESAGDEGAGGGTPGGQNQRL